MLYIVRTGPPYFDMILERMRNKIPSQSTIYVNKDDNYNALRNNLKYSPVFGRYYLVVVNFNPKDKELMNFITWATVTVKYIKVVLYVKTKVDLITAQQRADLKKIPKVVYDNYKASKTDKDLYISYYLNKYGVSLNPACMEALRRRLNGYTIEVNSFLEKIALMDNITVKAIQKLIPKRSQLTATSFGYLLFSEEFEYKDFIKLISEYRYSPKIIYQSVADYHKKIMKLYSPYLTGEFTEVNYKTFLVQNGTKYGLSSEFQAKSILDIFSRYSYPKLIMISYILSDVDYKRLSYIISLYKVVCLCRG